MINQPLTPTLLLILTLLLAGCDENEGSVFVTEGGCYGRTRPRVTVTQEITPNSVKCTVELRIGK